MTTQQAPSVPSTPAPWRASFLSHVSSMKPPTFTLATLHPVPGPSSQPAPSLPVVPRARTCIYRGLWAGLSADDVDDSNRNPARLNPPLWESDLPTFTTDARMEKAGELTDTAPDVAAGGGGQMGGGGGGPVEAVWWVESAGTQWRVRGNAWVLGPDADGEAGRRAREAILARMRRRDPGNTHQEEKKRDPKKEEEDDKEDWSWAREVTAHFGNLSPGMRGSFRSPPPGTPITYPPAEGEGVGQEVDDLEDEIARRNFRVVVIVPDEVDQVEYLDPKKPRRWLYVYRGRSWQAKESGGEIIGEWEKVEVWP